MSIIRLARLATLVGYFGLLILLMLWYALLAPSSHFPVALTLILLVGPLLFPLRGLLHGKPYTHAWTSMLALLYFTHGVTEAWSNEAVRHYALLEIFFSALLFVGAVGYARYQSRALRVP